MQIGLWSSVVFLAGCSYSSLDDEILPALLDVEIAVDPSRPTESATIVAQLELRGGPTASSLAVLDRITLEDSGGELAELALQFPTGFDAFIHESETKVVDLENAGTTNAELAAFCGTTLTLRVSLADTDEPGTYTLTSRPVTVVCN
jgi:hypothetical protein